MAVGTSLVLFVEEVYEKQLSYIRILGFQYWVFFHHWALKIQLAEGTCGVERRSCLFSQEQQGRKKARNKRCSSNHKRCVGCTGLSV